MASAGAATAATGGNFILGHKNTARTATVLRNTNASGGPALRLSTARKTTPNFTVSNKAAIHNLNADLLDGLDSSALQRRVSGTCSTAIVAINRSGSVGCEAAPVTQGAGSLDYTVPAGVHQLEVRLWAGGGSGGDGDGNASGGGGGQGASVDAMVTVSPGDVLHVTVGAGGVRNYAGFVDNGVAGGDSTITYSAAGSGSPVTILTAHGGAGGTASFNGCNVSSAPGGAPEADAAPALGLASATGAAGVAGVCSGGAVGGLGGGTGSAGAGGQGGTETSDGSAVSTFLGRPGSDGLVIVTPTLG